MRLKLGKPTDLENLNDKAVQTKPLVLYIIDIRSLNPSRSCIHISIMLSCCYKFMYLSHVYKSERQSLTEGIILI